MNAAEECADSSAADLMAAICKMHWSPDSSCLDCSARRHPDKAFETLREVVARATVMKGVRGEAGEVVKFVLAGLEKS